MNIFIRSELEKTRDVFDEMLKDEKFFKQIEDVVNAASEAISIENKIIFCGNGGSASFSQHLASKLVNKINLDRPGIPALSLSFDSGSNPENCYARQIEAIGKEGDLVICFSANGTSPSIIQAIKTARTKNIQVAAFLGRIGRDIGTLVDYSINIPSDEPAKIQEGQIAAANILCALIEEQAYGSGKAAYSKSAADPLVSTSIKQTVFA